MPAHALSIAIGYSASGTPPEVTPPGGDQTRSLTVNVVPAGSATVAIAANAATVVSGGQVKVGINVDLTLTKVGTPTFVSIAYLPATPAIAGLTVAGGATGLWAFDMPDRDLTITVTYTTDSGQNPPGGNSGPPMTPVTGQIMVYSNGAMLTGEPGWAEGRTNSPLMVYENGQGMTVGAEDGGSSDGTNTKSFSIWFDTSKGWTAGCFLLNASNNISTSGYNLRLYIKGADVTAWLNNDAGTESGDFTITGSADWTERTLPINGNFNILTLGFTCTGETTWLDNIRFVPK